MSATAVLHFYRIFRGNLERGAEEAWLSAKRHVAFRKRLGKMVKDSRKRSAAAKRGWKQRQRGFQ